MSNPFPITSNAPAVLYGLGLFETLLVAGGRVIDGDAHYERMRASAVSLNIAIPDRPSFDDAIAAASNECDDTEDAALRINWYAVAPNLDDSASWLCSATSSPIPRATIERRSDARAITLANEQQRSLPRHKTTSYAVCTLALRDAIAHGANEALFVDASGHVLEGTATNVFAVTRDSLITAPPTSILPGIVRGWVLDEAVRLGVRIELRAPSVVELCEGAFLTSSLTTIAPLRIVDGRTCAAPNELVRTIQGAWSKHVASGAMSG